MPSPLWEDLDDFLDEDEFAVPAVIHLRGGGQVTLSVIFDDPYINAELDDGLSRDGVMPHVTCKESLVGAVRRGDTFTLSLPGGARTYDITRAAEPDGTGIARLSLAQQ
jgi:hypothetical protein